MGRAASKDCTPDDLVRLILVRFGIPWLVSWNIYQQRGGSLLTFHYLVSTWFGIVLHLKGQQLVCWNIFGLKPIKLHNSMVWFGQLLVCWNIYQQGGGSLSALFHLYHRRQQQQKPWLLIKLVLCESFPWLWLVDSYILCWTGHSRRIRNGRDWRRRICHGGGGRWSSLGPKLCSSQHPHIRFFWNSFYAGLFFFWLSAFNQILVF